MEEVTWIMIVYIVVTDLIPKFLPDALKIWDKSISREDRLFKIIEEQNNTNKDIAVALERVSSSNEQLTDAMVGFDKRLAAIENKCRS